MYEQIWEKILDARHIVLASHIHPDGDTLGSSLAMYSVLKELGKKVSIYNKTKDEAPHEFDFLFGYEKISQKLPNYFDLLISFDCGSFDRLGLEKGSFEIINIDHHLSNELYGNFNIVLPTFSSAGMVVYEFIKQNNVNISKKTATCLYASIASDTGFFRYGNIDDKTFEVAAHLVSLGVSPKEIDENVNARTSLAKVRLKSHMFSNFELHDDASIASIVFKKDILIQTGAKRSDTKNIISQLRDIANVKVAFMLLEQNGFYKISLRSYGDVDVSKIATSYNGGGHNSSAGFSVDGNDEKKIQEEIIMRIMNEKK